MRHRRWIFAIAAVAGLACRGQSEATDDAGPLPLADYISPVTVSLECDPMCGPNNDVPSVDVEISVHKNAHRIPWHTLPAGPSTYPLRIESKGSVAYGPWNLPAGATAYIYNGRPRPGIRSVALVTKGSGPPELLKDAVKVGFCLTEPDSKASFHINAPPKCIGGLPVPTATMAAATAGATQSLSRNSGLWISCSSGCCEVQLAN